jgi:ribA/ribD-fused uncharacterized protein
VADTIWFYAQTEPFAEFSNFAPFGIEIDGLWWPTVEHYFQAQKFTDAAWREKIRLSNSPKAAKALGLTRTLPIRADWDRARDGVMVAAVRRKFATHPRPRALLLSTGAARIVENAPDLYWGGGPAGSGLNRLGEILMQVRAELRGSDADG